MHLVSRGRQRATIGNGVEGCERAEFLLDDGETIWTESSYKYTPTQIAGVLAQAGFRLVDQWIDWRGAFALTLVETS